MINLLPGLFLVSEPFKHSLLLHKGTTRGRSATPAQGSKAPTTEKATGNIK
jgi:hypothetical protein